MDAPTFIEPRSNPPPNGFWFFRMGDDSVETPIYDYALRKTGEILLKHGITDVSAVTALAEYMCPQMPPWFCRGAKTSSPVILAADARENAKAYFVRRMVPVDEIIRRMERCMACPKHRRDFCLHCEGHDAWIEHGFGGRRVRLPADDASGCCTCARTFEAVISSVYYEPGDDVWEGAPDSCWRKDK